MSKIDKKTIIIVMLVVCFIVAGWALFRSDIYNDGSRIDEIRDNISGVKEQQRSTIKRLESVESGLADSQGRLGEIQEGIRATEKNLDGIASGIEQSAERTRTDTGRIAEGERILAAIRERSQGTREEIKE